MKQVLFSCVGTSDPVRGEHDGPMLHIIRNYRPERVYLFITDEIREMDKEDNRLEETWTWMRKHWGGYAPELCRIESDIKKVYDMDALEMPLRDAINQISKDNPEAEILINVTSGTPQMQMILSQMAMDMRYRARGVQVWNHEKSSGRSQRTNDKKYDLELQLEFNEDEQEEAENRCIEPKMYAMQREYLRRQITTLLDERNFDAVKKMSDSIPDNLGILARHLAARNRLQGPEAWREASKIKDLPFKLYPYRSGSRGEYSEVSEYYLLMKNLATTGDWSEFLLHLEPLTLKLQLAVLGKMLQSVGHRKEEFITEDRDRIQFDPDSLQTSFPDLYAHYLQTLTKRRWERKRTEISTYLCDDLLSFFSNVPEMATHLFLHYSMLKDLRNRLAHSFCAVTEMNIRAACLADTSVLLKEIEETIRFCYEACDPSLFSVYDKSIEYIKTNL